MTLKENLNIILDGTPRRRLVMVLIGTLIAGLLEILGIGTTPAFVGVLIDPDWVLSVLPGRLGANWMHQTTRSDLLLWGATLLCGIFLFKNLYVVVLMYGETYFAQHLAASISNRLFCAYMKSPYQFHLQRNPAEFIRLVTEEAFYAMHFVRAGLRLIREGVVLALVLLLMVVVEPLATGAVFLLLALLSGIFYSAARRVLTSHGQRWVRHWTPPSSRYPKLWRHQRCQDTGTRTSFHGGLPVSNGPSPAPRNFPRDCGCCTPLLPRNSGSRIRGSDRCDLYPA